MPQLASINLVGLGSNFAVPGVYFQLDFAQGPVSGAGSPRYALLVGNKGTAGTATNDTVIYGPDTQTTCQTEADVIGLFATGSQLHRMYLRFVAVNPSIALYFIAVSPSAGAAATVVATFATTALSNGNVRFWVEDQFVDTSISTGDTATVVGANVAASINSQTRWPVTANAVTGAVTLTAKNLGPEGNWIRCQSLITPTTATIGTTTTLTANTFMTGGTTPDVNTTALSTILPFRYYYIVSGDSDATNVGRLVTQVNAQAQPTVGIRQRVFYGSMDTLANTITNATGINAPRAECIWGNSTDLTPAELAANNAALYSLLEAGAAVGVNRKNFSLFPTSATDSTLWLLKAGRNGAGGAPTGAQIISALNNGITPINVLPNGVSQLTKRVTTRSLNGATADYRIRDAHKVTVPDWWGDDAVAITQLQFGGRDLLPDPQQGQPPPPPIAVTPAIWGGALKGLVKNYGNSGQWDTPGGQPLPSGQDAADYINAHAIVQRETSPTTRMSALFQLTPVSIADQFMVLAQQTGAVILAIGSALALFGHFVS
jgi:phage tail sheath gpL-like